MQTRDGKYLFLDDMDRSMINHQNKDSVVNVLQAEQLADTEIKTTPRIINGVIPVDPNEDRHVVDSAPKPAGVPAPAPPVATPKPAALQPKAGNLGTAGKGAIPPAAMVVKPVDNTKVLSGPFLEWLPSLPSNDDGIDDITIVTAYINIGKYKNDETNFYYSPDLFRSWMMLFAKIENPVIAYLNDGQDYDLFNNVRMKLPSAKSKVVRVAKEKLWAFSLLPNVTDIYKNTTYPKHNPNTVVPHYTCISHAKYEFLAMAMRDNPFNTKYYAWVDVGIFRNMAAQVDTLPTFSMYLPPMLDTNKVAYAQVADREEDLTAKDIILNQKIWVSGSMFLAKSSIMKKWIQLYVKYLNNFLSQGLMNTDQYITHAMLQSGDELSPQIQTYTWQGIHTAQHYLAYLCKDEGERRKKLSAIKMGAKGP